MTTKLENWTTIPDDKVRHIWCPADSDAEISVPPSFYSESGTPVDPETGDDMEYIRTEILP